jgi:hypothetical protein
MHPNRRVVLESVRRVRDGNEPHKHAPFARHTMRIPEQDFIALRKLYPDLANFNDPDAQRAAWDRFEKSAFSEPYRVGRVVRGVVKNGVILK